MNADAFVLSTAMLEEPVHPTSQPSKDSTEAAPRSSPILLNPRLYQMQIFRCAVERNTLAFLPTGAGKTLIAVMLIKHFLNIRWNPSCSQSTAEEVEDELCADSHHQLVAFIAPTKVLVDQQRAYIASNCDARVITCTGDSVCNGRRIDRWRVREWNMEMSRADVVVITPEVLRHSLAMRLLGVHRFCLLILDECHHAVGQHPMTKLCEIVLRAPASARPPPRILGLTASPIGKKGCLASMIGSLEDTLGCKMAAQIEDIEELFLLNPRPALFVLPHGPFAQPATNQAATSSSSSAIGSAGGDRLVYAHVLCRHSSYMHAFLLLTQFLNLSFRDMNIFDRLQVPVVEEPISTTSKQEGSILEYLQHSISQLQSIYAESGALCTFFALGTVLNRVRTRKHIATAITKVNEERISEQVQEIITGAPSVSPVPVPLLLQFRLVAVVSLLECLAGLMSGLPTSLKHTVIFAYSVSKGSNEETSESKEAAASRIVLTVLQWPHDSSLSCMDLMVPETDNLPELFYFVNQISAVVSLVRSSISAADIPTYGPTLVPWDAFSPIVATPESVITSNLLSPKVVALINYFLQRLRGNDETRPAVNSWAAIVFSNMRLTSMALSKTLNLVLGLLDPECTPFEEVPVEGSSASVSKAAPLSKHVTGNMNLRDQVLTLLSFRNNSFPILFASDVIEEGVDIKICDLVINYDCPDTLKSWIQRRGRARAIASSMITMIETSAAGIASFDELKLLVKQDVELNEFINGSRSDIMEIGNSNRRSGMQKYTVVATGASIDYICAVQLISKYCDRLPKSKYSFCTPLFWSIKLSSAEYQCALLLPPAVPGAVRCAISPIVSNKSLAKGLVALESVIQLHMHGLLNDWLEIIKSEEKPTPAPALARSAPLQTDAADDADSVQIDVKYVADSMSHQAVQYGLGNLLLYIYAFEVVSKDPVPSAMFRTKSIIDALQNVAVCFPTRLPNVDSLDLRTREGNPLSITIKWLGVHIFTPAELIFIQRYHRAVLGWTIDSTPDVTPLDEWSRSSNGAFYYIMPLHPSMTYVTATYNDDSIVVPTDWIDFLKTSAEEAQFLVENIIRHRDLVCDFVDEAFPEETGIDVTATDSSTATSMKKITTHYFNPRVNAKDLEGKLLSHYIGHFSAIIEHDHRRITETMMKSKGAPVSFYEHFLSRGTLPADAIEVMKNDPSHMLLPVHGVSGKLTAENLIEELKAEGTNIHAHGVQYLVPELCEVLGELKYYFTGVGLPSLLWRVQALYLADECLEYIHGLYEKQFPSNGEKRLLLFPSTAAMLQAMTPRLSLENMDSERLEMLGDSVFKLAVASTLYDMFPKAHEGQLTKLRSALISNEAQARQAEATGLSRYLRAVSFFFGQQLNFRPPGLSTALTSAWNETVDQNYRKNKEFEGAPIVTAGLQFCKATVKQKRIADLVESIVGVFYLAGGIPSAIYALKALQLFPTFPDSPVKNQDEIIDQIIADTNAMDVSSSENEVIIPENYPVDLERLARTKASDRVYVEYVNSCLDSLISAPIEPTLALGTVEDRIGYVFSNKSYLTQALTHASIIGSPSYERLEFLGDAVLDLVIVKILYDSSNNYNPGKLSEYKSYVTNNAYLGNVAIKLGIYKNLLIMNGEAQEVFKNVLISQEMGLPVQFDASNISNLISQSALDIMADCLEAIFGAIYLDSNSDLAVIKRVVAHIALIPVEIIL